MMIENLKTRLAERKKTLQDMDMTRTKLESQLAQANNAIFQLQGAVFELTDVIETAEKPVDTGSAGNIAAPNSTTPDNKKKSGCEQKETGQDKK